MLEQDEWIPVEDVQRDAISLCPSAIWSSQGLLAFGTPDDPEAATLQWRRKD